MEPTRVAVVNLGRVFDQHRNHAGHNEEGDGPLERVVEAVFEFRVKQPLINESQQGSFRRVGVFGHVYILTHAECWKNKKKAPIKEPLSQIGYLF